MIYVINSFSYIIKITIELIGSTTAVILSSLNQVAYLMHILKTIPNIFLLSSQLSQQQ